MFVRPELPGDRVDVRTVHTAAFGQVGRGGPGRLPAGHRRVAAVAAPWSPSTTASIVGHVLFTTCCSPAVRYCRSRRSACIPDHQRAGIGSALVRTGLAIAERTDRGLVVVLGNPAYYGRFGFLSSGAQGVIDPFQGPDGHFQLRRLPGYKAGLIGTVIYPPVFASL